MPRLFRCALHSWSAARAAVLRRRNDAVIGRSSNAARFPRLPGFARTFFRDEVEGGWFLATGQARACSRRPLPGVINVVYSFLPSTHRDFSPIDRTMPPFLRALDDTGRR